LVVLQPANRLGRKEPNDDHIRVDFHPEFQQIASMDSDSGEFQEKWLAHREEAERFYRDLAAGPKVRVGMEASGHARWFERLLDYERALVGRAKSKRLNESEMALFYECALKCARKLLDSGDIG
jgi:hypothetical protein